MCTGLPIGVACRQTPVAATICRLSVARYRSCARFLARFPAACGPGCGLARHDANEAFGVRCDASRSAETLAHQSVGHATMRDGPGHARVVRQRIRAVRRLGGIDLKSTRMTSSFLYL